MSNLIQCNSCRELSSMKSYFIPWPGNYVKVLCDKCSEEMLYCYNWTIFLTLINKKIWKKC